MDFEKDFEEGFENTSLGSIHYKHHIGTREKLIFLHGLGANIRVWRQLMKYMPPDLDISLIDLLGHGESDAPDIDYTISDQFQALREFISLRNNGDSYIFGHSYGGWVAAYYASQPYTCKGIILEDSAGLKENFEDIVKSGNAERYKEQLIKSALLINNNKEHVIRSLVESDFKEDQLTTAVLSTIKTPALIIWGSEDPIGDKKYAKIFQEKIRNSKLAIIEGAGHDSHYTNPQEVSALILDFIK